MINEQKIQQFIRNEWASYADYDNRRSLPHIMDGLKTTHRKAIHTALALPKDGKFIKVSQFAAKAAEYTAYHHGEVSMISGIVSLAQQFPGSNNYPLLERQGQFGTRLSNKPGGSRYIFTKLSKNWETFFKKEDQEFVEPQFEEGEEIEPSYFIPILPMILLNGSDGVGNGYKSKIWNYDVKDVANACREVVKYGAVKTKLVPHMEGWKGTITKHDNQLIFTGNLKIVNTTKLEITELPPKYDNEKYKKFLNKLVDKKVIKDYQNRSTEDFWHWIIDCPRETSALGHEKLLDLLGLIEKDTETLVGWGINSEYPLTFKSTEDLIQYWCVERLKLYQKTIDAQIKKAKAAVVRADLKIRFVTWCLKNDFRKLSRSEFIEKSVAGVKGLTTDIAGEFVAMPMYRITTDEVAKIEKEIDLVMDALEELESTTPEKLNDRNLKGL